jgi:hypothetical protein
MQLKVFLKLKKPQKLSSGQIYKKPQKNPKTQKTQKKTKNPKNPLGWVFFQPCLQLERVGAPVLLLHEVR